MSNPMIPIQTYVGQISVVGECFCYGVVLDGQQVVYLDVAGPATSIEAVWAKLAQGKECMILPPEATTDKIVLRTAEGVLKRMQRKIEGIGIYHLLLLHEEMLEPTYAELTTTYLFLIDKAQTTAKLGAHIQELVDLAVFPEWYPYFVQQGRMEKLILPLKCHGGVQVWKIILDKPAWERVICQGLRHCSITFPA